MKSLPLFCLIFLFQVSFAQNKAPLVKQWDARFGGSMYSELYCFQQTKDGGYILGGRSNCLISGQKTQNSNGGNDYWVVKIDSFGNKEWDKDFGGSEDDDLASLQQTADGGYILGGSSASPKVGDKSQNLKGTWDFWVIKIDSLGNKEWDKDYGGSNVNALNSIRQTRDGGYLFGGYSSSNASGDKTQNTYGGEDYWVIKTDALGNKKWDKDFGGTTNEELRCLVQTTDGGYFLGGFSASSLSGNKTQGAKGGNDYWVVRIDSLGNKLWDKDFGGGKSEYLYSVIQARDGGYLLGGISNSGKGGDKTQPDLDPTLATFDYWIIKLDTNGNKLWDKDFGGTIDDDAVGSVFQVSDGGYLVAGNSYSSVSGNKTENNLGIEQTWIFKIDSIGDFLWDKTIFTRSHDENGFAIQTSDGGYAVANSTAADTGGYKSQMDRGYWIVKFGDTTYCSLVQPGKITANTFSICPGNTLQLTATSYTGQVQWQFSTDGHSFSNIPGATSAVYNSGALSQNSYYRIKASNTCAASYSGIQFVNILPTPSAGVVSALQDTVCTGSEANLQTVGSSGNLQWQSSPDGISFTDISGAISSSYYPQVLSSKIYYRVKGYNVCDTSYSNIKLIGSVAAPVAGSVSPGRDTICTGNVVVLNSSLSNGSVQWQTSTDGSSFTDITGATSPAYTTFPLLLNTYFRIKAENSCAADYSNLAFMYVLPFPVAGNISAVQDTVCAGNVVQLSSAGNGSNIQWQSSGDGISFTDITGATSAGYSPAGLTQKTYYRVKALNGCDTVYSNIQLINVFPIPVAGTISIPKNPICTNMKGHLTVNGNSGGPIQWQTSPDGISFTDIPGATTTEYVTPPVTQTTYYKVIAGTGPCSATSAVLKLDIIALPMALYNYTELNSFVGFDGSQSTGAVAYFWDFGDGDTSDIVNPVHNYDTAGVYHVCLTVKNISNCYFTLCKNIQIFPTGVTEITSPGKWNIYPEPFTNYFYIEQSLSNLSVKTIEMYNVLGQVVLNRKFETGDNILKIDGSNLPTGIYYLKIKTQQQDYVQPMVKQ